MNNRLAEIISGFCKDIGLQNFMLDTFRKADEHKIVAILSRQIEFDPHDLLAENFAATFTDKFHPLKDDIENSPLIARIRASHTEEVQSLKEQIKTLEKQNMKLSEAFTNGMEMLDGEIPDEQPES